MNQLNVGTDGKLAQLLHKRAKQSLHTHTYIHTKTERYYILFVYKST